MQISFFFLRRHWVVLIIATLLMTPGCARSLLASPADEGLILEEASWMDRSGRASFEDVRQQQSWQLFSGWKSFGFGPEPIWIRLRLKAAEAGATNPWIVQVRPAYLDRLTLYDPAAGLELHSGDAIPPTDDALVSLAFTFQIPALPYEREIYLKLETTSTRTVQLTVLPYRQAQQHIYQQEWPLGFLFALSIIFALWALAQWWQTREIVIGAFVFKQAVAALWAFFILGFARCMIGSWLPSGLLTAIASCSVPWTIGATAWFMSILLREYQVHRLCLTSLSGIAVFLWLLPLMQLAGMTRESLHIANLFIPIVAILLLGGIISSANSEAHPAIPWQFLLVYLLIYCSLNALPSAIHFNLLPGSAIVMVGQLAHIVMDGGIMFIILQFRASALKHMQRQTAMELLLTRKQAEIERLQREDQGKLFTMLVHEIKNPLASLRMWLEAGLLPRKRDNLERAITDMNQVIERCVHTSQLGDQRLQPVVQPIDLLELTQSCIQACREPNKVDIEASENMPLLHTDAQMLTIVLSNLLDNACKYSPPHSRVVVSLQSPATSSAAGICWRVTNMAGTAGLPDANQLFEKYYRSAHARRLPGSGLGLFLVRGLLELMQGRIKYAPQEEAVIFTIWLPLKPEAG